MRQKPRRREEGEKEEKVSGTKKGHAVLQKRKSRIEQELPKECLTLAHVLAQDGPRVAQGLSHDCLTFWPKMGLQSQIYDRGWVSLACFGKLWSRSVL